MKKILCVILITVLFLLSACTKAPDAEQTADTTQPESTAEVTAAAEESTEAVKENTQAVAIETKTQASATEENMADYISGSEAPPPASRFTLEQLKEYKNAYSTMNDEDFLQFVIKADNLADTDIRSREEGKAMVEAIENTTVVLLDADKTNFRKMNYSELSYTISQPVKMSETRNLVCTYYTDLSEDNYKKVYENSETITYVTDITVNGVTASVYRRSNSVTGVDEFLAELFVDGTRISYRVTEEQTIEEFEADLARLEFVKIGDLLEE